MNITEIIGYIGSLGILVSFLMKDINRLRIVNTIGCAFFVLYGILLNYSIPVIATNAIIILINVYYLLKNNKEN
ncbi:MAG: hypothetical protein JWO09_192 [Bacteroidetes bacterium]|nr:hypothetical protein [Bacteroidota bacterium]